MWECVHCTLENVKRNLSLPECSSKTEKTTMLPGRYNWQTDMEDHQHGSIIPETSKHLHYSN